MTTEYEALMKSIKNTRTLKASRQTAIDELKADFTAQLEYLENLEIRMLSQNDESDAIEENLDYLVRDNSELKHNHTTETRLRAIQILKDWNDEIEALEHYNRDVTEDPDADYIQYDKENAEGID